MNVVKLNLANQITLLRFLCIPVFAASVLYLEAGRLYLKYAPLCIFFIAVVSDALDGFAARILDQKTKLGTWLDPIADKLLLVTSFILLGFINGVSALKIPIWLIIIVLSRDCVIVLGSIFIHMLKGSLFVAPSFIGKITTFFQMLVILTALLKVPVGMDYLWALTAGLTLISGLDYFLKGVRQLNSIKN